MPANPHQGDIERSLEFSQNENKTSTNVSAAKSSFNQFNDARSNKNPSQQSKQSPAGAQNTTTGPVRPQQTNKFQGPNVAPSVASGTPTAGPGAGKIDADLINVVNENRVILNVGGIRHETYKVSLLYAINNCFSSITLI